ncbi:hypothetical protein BDV38DRAFT_177942 [Aspergillus pseudotamarii]|uniref:Uncharacterized protein n=1 Tax=Aspergillus pseudotamarii TaxID=132259 RepID=A0A5N6T6S3_ASPPS|nr:uncharacterized protein BDV38DRAFT_177942 [Aspergillus pseudotamarii]KAE8142048.1 hypothetical protein BDV38DRAFT_177942 [Aspergillus pseudotamarii]
MDTCQVKENRHHEAPVGYDDQGRASILPYSQTTRFYPGDLVHVSVRRCHDAIETHGPYLVEMVISGKYTLCMDDGTEVSVDGKTVFEESDLVEAV